MRLENAKNYSPIESILKAKQDVDKKERGEKDPMQEQVNDPSKTVFRDRLIQFLVEQQNNKRLPGKDEVATMLISNIAPNFTPDARTARIINKLLENEELEEDQSCIEGAFFDYFENTIRAYSDTEIEDIWVANIMATVPGHLQGNFPDIVSATLEEVKMEFRESGKTCAVKHILRKPIKSKQELQELKSIVKSYTPPLVSPWRDSFLQSKAKIERSLFICHPLFVEILEIWTHYDSTRIVDKQKITTQREAYRIFTFRSLIMVQAEKTRSKLWNGYPLVM